LTPRGRCKERRQGGPPPSPLLRRTLGGGGQLCTLVYQPLQAGKTQPVGGIFGTIFFHPSPLSSAGLSTGRPPPRRTEQEC